MEYFEQAFEQKVIEQDDSAPNLTPNSMRAKYSELRNLTEAVDSDSTRRLVRELQQIRFDSQEEAAYAFAMVFYQLSIDQQQEYGAVIYKSNGSYRLSINNSANSASMRNLWGDVNYEYDGSNLPAYNENDNFPQLRTRVTMPYASNIVAEIHTHWTPNGNLDFSDELDRDRVISNGINAYLVNVKGEILISKPDGKGGYTESQRLWTLP